jgi:cyclic lactone autoinducer peptide
MKKNNKLAGKIVKVLNSYLKLEANSASSICMHQPKAPKELNKFRR